MKAIRNQQIHNFTTFNCILPSCINELSQRKTEGICSNLITILSAICSSVRWIGNFSDDLYSLSMSQNNLQGHIPDEIRTVYLDLSPNNLSGALPSCYMLLLGKERFGEH